MMPRHAFLACLLVLLLPIDSPGDDALRQWPQWRGPLANGLAPTAQPPVEWSESRNVKWKIPVPGRGSSTPVIWNDQVFILTAIPVAGRPASEAGGADASTAPSAPAATGIRAMVEAPGAPQQFVVLAYDRSTGAERWRRVVRQQLPHEGHHKDHGYASGSPVTDGRILVASFGSHGTYAMHLDGRPIWDRDLGDQSTRNGFGEGTSPTLHGNLVLVLWDHEGDDFLVALDKETGREVWRVLRDEPTGWTTPFVVEHEGRHQVIVNATRRVRSYDLETGRLLWECGGQTSNAIPTPVAGNGLVHVTSGHRGSSLQTIRLGRTGDLTDTDAVVWRHSKNTPYVPSPLLYDGLLYLFSGNNALLSVFDAATGERHVDAERLSGLTGVYASPIGVQDRVYLLGRDGGALVLKKSRRLEVLATNRLDDGFDASPAAVGRELFLRGREHLYCLATTP